MKIRWITSLFLLLVLSLAACNGGETPAPAPTDTPTVQTEAAQPAEEDRAAEPAPTDTPAATDTPVPTDTPAPTPTELPTPLPVSVVATPTPAPALAADPCDQSLTGQDAQLAEQFPALGCPEGSPNFVYLAQQPFQNGRMIWREDNATIYVLYNDGVWHSFEDTFEEGQPETDPNIVAPEGLFQPARGFGKVWREKLGGPDAAVGWATLPEQGVNASVQAWENGLLFSFGIPERYVLFDDGRWEQVS